MNKRFFTAVVLAFVFVTGFEFVEHQLWLKSTYASTPNLWRADTDIKMWAIMLGHILYAFLGVAIYSKGHQGKGMGEGVRFGILFGAIAIPCNLVAYAVQPMPESLVVCWSIASIVEGIGIGLIASNRYSSH